MMKVFMYRDLQVIERNDIKVINIKYLGEKKAIDDAYDQILKKAINFCNSDLSMPKRVAERTSDQILCQEIKLHMRRYCDAKNEGQRYVPLVNVLNAILCLDNKDPRVVFVVNDPMIVESDHLPAKSKRKPDIIKVSLKTFKLWLQLPEHTTFNECRKLVAKRKFKIFEKPYWMDVAQFWELKFGHHLGNVKDMLKRLISRDLLEATVLVESASAPLLDNTAVAESSSMAGKRKKQDDQEDPKPKKNPRTLLKAAGGQIMPPPGSS